MYIFLHHIDGNIVYFYFFWKRYGTISLIYINTSMNEATILSVLYMVI